ncbi:hypothetical protein L5515_007156 [Caenorhabditis briggsae]|uniref:Uncharacterized protein n=2 Tax=Caenorhabditis briggsae TaxID=6238 RepID=A0AAE9JJQ2_CAEBR|nr:hypothetical protein L5515_007156 [Caenorhabditis briggsae]
MQRSRFCLLDLNTKNKTELSEEFRNSVHAKALSIFYWRQVQEIEGKFPEYLFLNLAVNWMNCSSWDHFLHKFPMESYNISEGKKLLDLLDYDCVPREFRNWCAEDPGRVLHFLYILESKYKLEMQFICDSAITRHPDPGYTWVYGGMSAVTVILGIMGASKVKKDWEIAKLQKLESETSNDPNLLNALPDQNPKFLRVPQRYRNRRMDSGKRMMEARKGFVEIERTTVVSCNACKMFFRRSNTEGVDEKCKKGGKCYDDLKYDLKKEDRPRCRACRYKKCVALGMRQHKSTDSESVTSPAAPASIPSPTSEKSIELAVVQKPIVTQAHVDSILFQQMTALHKTRKEVYLTINICEDPSFLDLVLEGSNLSKYRRPQPIEWEKTERKLKPWGSLGVLLIVEIIKAMPFYEKLLLSDRVILLKNVAFKSHHLAIAFDSFMAKKGRVIAPNGEEMFPSALFEIEECNEIIMDLLTSPMQPILELNLTENEYLLLNMIMICNPGIAGLSLSAQSIISEQQRSATKLLFYLCMIWDPLEGPGRFGKILAIGENLNKQASIMKKLDKTIKQKNLGIYIPKVLREPCNIK